MCIYNFFFFIFAGVNIWFLNNILNVYIFLVNILRNSNYCVYVYLHVVFFFVLNCLTFVTTREKKNLIKQMLTKNLRSQRLNRLSFWFLWPTESSKFNRLEPFVKMFDHFAMTYHIVSNDWLILDLEKNPLDVWCM